MLGEYQEGGFKMKRAEWLCLGAGMILFFVCMWRESWPVGALSAFFIFCSWMFKERKPDNISEKCLICGSDFSEFSRPFLICEDCGTSALLDRKEKQFILSAPTHPQARVHWH